MKYKYAILVICLFSILISCKDDLDEKISISDCSIQDIENQPINTFQVIATHNSYRKKTYAAIFNILSLAIEILPDGIIPEGSNPLLEWDYGHRSLPIQLNDFHVRSFEIDLYNDPNGGLFADRYGKALVGQAVASGEPALDEPGLKVMHVPHIDFMTHYLTFKESLEALLQWSNENPNHFPISVMLELKDYGDAPIISDIIYPFDEAAKLSIVTELLSVFPEDKLLTPKDMRTHETLEASIAANGWPTLAESRGKVMFIAMGQEEISEVVFGCGDTLTNSVNQIFKVMDKPVDDFNKIQEAVDNGFMIRTRADESTKQARTGDVTDREKAFESGAQIISTDYPYADSRHIAQPQNWTDYKVQFGDGIVARSNKNNSCIVMERLN